MPLSCGYGFQVCRLGNGLPIMQPSDPSGRLIVVGASAGGVQSLKDLVSHFPPALDAGVLIVLHLSADSVSVLADILGGAGPLPARFAVGRQPVAPGTILVAPPGRHLLIEDGHAVLSSGPRENGHRPAIDPLFRSAALAYGARVAGVLLSGSLDDGVGGLGAIKRAGGRAFVQDPDEAQHPSMPLNAIARVPLDGVMKIAELADSLVRFVMEKHTKPRVLRAEHAAIGSIAPPPGKGEGMDRLEREGRLTGLTCPACGGAIWEVEHEGSSEFRCHVGHAYAAQTFAAEHGIAVEHALWSAVRSLKEKQELLERLGDRAHEEGRARSARAFFERATEVSRSADAVRRVAESAGSADSASQLLGEGKQEVPA